MADPDRCPASRIDADGSGDGLPSRAMIAPPMLKVLPGWFALHSLINGPIIREKFLLGGGLGVRGIYGPP
jgi:hypothetical protein